MLSAASHQCCCTCCCNGLPTHKIHCSVLAEEAVKAAVKNYYDKNGIEYDHEKFAETHNCDHCVE